MYFLFFCISAHQRLLTEFCFTNCGFLTAALPYRPASQSLLFTVYVDTFFMTLVQLCCAVSSSQPSVEKAGDFEKTFLCVGKTGSILQAVIQFNII